MSELPQPLFDRIGGRSGLLKLLRHFYADVRQQEVIGPIFNAHIKDWPAHLENIANFWSGILGGPAKYRGGMPIKHLALGLGEEHFQAWLGLWKRNCTTHLPQSEATEMTAIADKIGLRLQTIIANHKKPTFDLFS
ncbi:group III truncated hemoglobin [Coraliomargarita sp. W4R53]